MSAAARALAVERVSVEDAAFLLAESPLMPMNIGVLAMLDGPAPAREEVCAQLAPRIGWLVRWRQRVVEVPARWRRPTWVEDADFAVERHVHERSVADHEAANGMHGVVAQIQSRHLERDKPLWELWLLRRRDAGPGAALLKLHHGMGDAVSASRVLERLFGSTPAPAATAPAGRAAGGDRRAARGDRRAGAARHATPLRIASAGGRAVDAATVSIEHVRALTGRLGVTVNDVVLALGARAVRAMLLERGTNLPPAELRTIVPVSLRAESDRATAGNELSAVAIDLPLATDPPEALLDEVHARVASAMAAHRLPERSTLGQALAGATPPALLRRVARRRFTSDDHDLVISSVRGPERLAIGGRTVERLVPLSFLSENHSLIVTALSYRSQLAFGLVADANSGLDLAHGARAIPAALADLRDAAGAAAARRGGQS